MNCVMSMNTMKKKMGWTNIFWKKNFFFDRKRETSFLEFEYYKKDLQTYEKKAKEKIYKTQKSIRTLADGINKLI